MKTLWFKVWDYLRSSLWFVPAVMALAAVAAAFGTVALDERMTKESLSHLGWRYTGDAEGASLMLGTLAGSMITVAGTVFSLTLVALSLASTQLGPVVGREPQLPGARAGVADDGSPHPTRIPGRYTPGEEDPGVRPVSRAGSLDRNRDAEIGVELPRFSGRLTAWFASGRWC